MSALIVLLPLSLLMATIALVGFIWATKRGQFDDLQSEGEIFLAEDRLKKGESGGRGNG